MELTINGEKIEAPDGLKLGELLEERGFAPQSVVVERNRELVLRENFASTRLEAGDSLEILHFVGGG